jgi:hypothetical protein
VTDTLHLDDEVLSALIDGELAEGERRAAIEHQLVCEACRRRSQELGRVADLVGCATGRSPEAALGTASALETVALETVALETVALETVALETAVVVAVAAFPVSSTSTAAFRSPWAAEVAQPSGRSGPSARRPGGRDGRSRRVLRAGASAVAVAAGVAIALAAFGHPGHATGGAGTAPATQATGLPSSLGSFSDPASLSSTLQAEIASLAPGASGQELPCHEKAALGVGRPAVTTAAFSAPLTYAGSPAQVFAYRTPAEGPGDRRDGVAVVVDNGGCTVVARLTW